MRKAGTVLAGFTVLLMSASAFAGELNPPPGPVTATDRVALHPEAGVPIIINEPGSYVLMGPVLDCIGCDDAPNSGIVISASDVTLDCNGFQIVGDPENSFNGIFIDFLTENITIRNGIVRNWSSGGITAGGSSGVTLENMRVFGNGFNGGAGGISISSEARIIDCVVRDNDGTGVFVGFGSLIRGTTATGNNGHGIQTVPGALSNGSVIENCVSRGNVGDGFNLADGTIIRGSSATQNGGSGIVLAPGSAATGCTAVFNSGSGFEASNALVHSSAAYNNSGTDITLFNNAVAIDSHDAP